LAGSLAKRGDFDGLRPQADVGDVHAAAQRLAELLVKHGQGEDAERFRRIDLNLDESIAYARRDVGTSLIYLSYSA
jgi:hypothetical protein